MGAEIRKAVRWTLLDAEAEFPIGRDTLSRRLHQLGEKPGDDAMFSTKQVCLAVFGDREREKARLERLQADRVELDNAERRRTLIPVSDALKLARKFTFAVVSSIRGDDSLSTETKNAVISKIRGLATVDFSALPEGEE